MWFNSDTVHWLLKEFLASKYFIQALKSKILLKLGIRVYAAKYCHIDFDLTMSDQQRLVIIL